MKTKLLFLAIAILCSTFTNAQWQQTSLNTEPAYCLALNGSNIFAGSNTGMYLSSNNGTNWSSANTGLTSNIIKSLAVSGTNIFAGTNGEGVFLSTNNGSSWTAVNTGITDLSITTLAVDGSTIFAGTNSGIFLSTNNGTSWTAVNTGLTCTDTYSIAISGTNIFAGTYTGGVFLSTNNGSSWTAVNTGLPDPSSAGIYSLAICGSTIFAGTEGYGIYRSLNNGSSWEATALMEAIVPAIVVCGTNVFAGTFEGVFLSTNNGVAWNAVNTGLSHTTVFSLALNSSTLFAGTIDGGVYKRTLAEMISGINEIDNEKSISIFPNPFSFETVLKTKNGFKNISLSIYNSFGQQVKQINNISGPTINVQRDNLPSGIYFIQLADENNVITTLKLIITD